jgi:predicted transcriptional regulator
MATRVTQVEKDLMWKLYQKSGSFKEVARIMGRSCGTVSRYVHEREAAVNAVRVVIDAQNT